MAGDVRPRALLRAGKAFIAVAVVLTVLSHTPNAFGSTRLTRWA